MTERMFPPDRTARRASITLACLLFLGVGLLLLPFYRFELTADAISYISIATEYTRGLWFEAVNAYWSPLYSWLLSALLVLGIPPIVAAKLVTLAAGVLVLIGVHRLSSLFEISTATERLFLFAGGLMALGFAFEENTPDLLFTALLFLYFGQIFDPSYPDRRYVGLVCGVLGAFAYLAKAYGLSFFLAHFTLFTAIHWLRFNNRIQRVSILRHYIVGLLAFCFGAGIWSAVLHGKYGVWTTSTAADYNFRIVGPKSPGYPHLRYLIPPQNGQVNAWQEPSATLLPGWNIADGSSSIKHELKVIMRNAKLIRGYWYHATPLWLACFLGYIVLCLSPGSRKLEWIALLFTLILLCAGYVLTNSLDGRYFWPTEFLLLLITFRTLDYVSSFNKLTRPAAYVLCWAVTLSFVIYPIGTLRDHFLAKRDLYNWTQQLKRTASITGNLASCGNWQDSAYVAYQLGLPYFGVICPTTEADEVAHELNPDYQATTDACTDSQQLELTLARARIDYMFVWPECKFPHQGDMSHC
jgi:hypothetical protein